LERAAAIRGLACSARPRRGTRAAAFARGLIVTPRGGPSSVPLLFVDTPSRVDLTMAPDSVLAIRRDGSAVRRASS